MEVSGIDRTLFVHPSSPVTILSQFHKYVSGKSSLCRGAISITAGTFVMSYNLKLQYFIAFLSNEDEFPFNTSPVFPGEGIFGPCLLHDADIVPVI